MITWIRKSITKRISLWLLLLGGAGGYAAYYYWDTAYSIPLPYCLAGGAALLLIFIILLHTYVNRPLRILTKQMKLLLTGRSYKKITTGRIDEIGIIAQFFNEITQNLESISQKLKEGQRMSSELEIASSIQRSILPAQSPDVPHLEVVAKSRPAVEVGGDSFDFIQRDNATYFYVGDVTGHGAPAALVMMMVNTLLHTYSEMYSSIYDIVVNTNKILKPRIKAAMFMTMVMLKWDHTKETLSYVGAGHEHLLIYRSKTGKVESIAAGGVALGMVPDNSKLVKEKQLNLEDGDMVVIYSDGITEAKNDKGEMFGLENLVALVQKYATQYGPEGVTYHTALDFSQYVGDAQQEDDITLMVLRYSKQGQAQEKKTSKSTNW
ncbi:SpoIIE family protein phosphatase [Candidatus Peregrinibacteria bacterium]|nr:SpoIIE family protein phosphatase [Candidatus Peregrinibacteria bacterium]